jgi:CBS domain containing-hemolysin-like protein
MQKSHIHIAIVLDSIGRTIGLVSTEDILEELVGDIWDEHEEAGYPVHEDKNGSFIVPGDAILSEVMKKIGIEFEAGDYQDNSISQFITHRIDRVPRRGDVVDAGTSKIIVRSMKSRRVREVRIVPVRTESSPETQET